jgi:hypothetical protein
MTLRSGHGAGAGVPRIEVLPADELPSGVLADASGAHALHVPDVARTPDGRLADGNAAAELGRRGGLARAAQRGKLRSLELLGLRLVPGADLSGLGDFLDDAEAFAEHEVQRLAMTVGGGLCGAGPASLVQTAALQLASSRYLWSLGSSDHVKMASSLGNDSRQNLLAAHELCAREAKARPQGNATERRLAALTAGT